MHDSLTHTQASWQKHLDFVSVCQRRRNDADQRKAHAQHMSRQDFLMHKEASDAWERGKRNFDAYVSENKARVRQEKEAKRQEVRGVVSVCVCVFVCVYVRA
jgi:hypothetical protein